MTPEFQSSSLLDLGVEQTSREMLISSRLAAHAIVIRDVLSATGTAFSHS